MNQRERVKKLIASRTGLEPLALNAAEAHQQEAEGGCGVIGIACSEQIAGRHLLQSLDQMRNRGNGKGGGIAAVGLSSEQFGVSAQVLADDYLLAVAYLDPEARQEVEAAHIRSTFEVDHVRFQPHLEDHTRLHGLDVRPPEVYQYFVRPKSDILEVFVQQNSFGGLAKRQIEDELVYQNSYRLNREFYSSTGEKQAFVLSHGKNLLVLKMVGFGDDVVRYYQLEDMLAHVWIGHHRYPTKGTVWHPGGAHPFVGLNEALVHNGDFANYASITEYLAQRNIHPLYLTDTEVSVLVFDLLHRIYDYPLEYVIESLAPTTERDFYMLPPDKQKLYEMLQLTHMHSSPDGPWFFLIAQSAASANAGSASTMDGAASEGQREDQNGLPKPSSQLESAEGEQEGSDSDGRSSDGSPALEPAILPHQTFRLVGITDTSMLRPQVFAWQQVGEEGPAVGFAASEKQAIDAAQASLTESDNRFWPRADKYWNARGGSHTDGGAFIFSVDAAGDGATSLTCSDKFGRQIRADTSKRPHLPVNGGVSYRHRARGQDPDFPSWISAEVSAEALFAKFVERLPALNYEQVLSFLQSLLSSSNVDRRRERTFELLTLLIDRQYPTGSLRRSSLLTMFDQCLAELVEGIRSTPSPGFTHADTRRAPPRPSSPEQAVIVDARTFAPEGPDSLAQEIKALIRSGFRRLILMHTRGHRFIGNGLGPGSDGIRIDVFGSPGDYLASGVDGATVLVHANGQDQLAQIMKSGKLVIHGDVGQTFMYAAKGGEAYVLGNAAGRPMINAVGKPRVVINGTCLDYLAESFMAGDPLNGGGFVILNGLTFGEDGVVHELDTPYPGSNLFSLASGGALYIRDPHHKVAVEQLNGGNFATMTGADWNLIRPYLDENERQFGIPVSRLLEVDGEVRQPQEVYRKIEPAAVRALQAEEAWVRRNHS